MEPLSSAHYRQSLRIKNQYRLLKTIREHGKVSRAQLSKLLNISAPSVSENVEILLDKKLIYEAGVGRSSGGRKPRELAFNENFRYVIAVSLQANQLRIALSNLNLETFEIKSFSDDFTKYSLESFIEIILKEIEKMITRCNISIKEVSSMVVSVPGIIHNNEIIRSKKFPYLEGKKLHKRLESVMELKVMIKNDVNAKTLGLYRELPDHYENIVYISPEPSGVGSGIMINGELYEGSKHGAGEIGSMVFNNLDFITGSQKPECLENIVSGKNVYQMMKQSEGQNENLKELVDERGKFDFSKLIVAYKKGNQTAQKAMRFIAKHYALAIHNISVILNPEIVILGGEFIEMGPDILKEIHLYLKNVENLPLKIELAQSDHDIQLRGTLSFGERYVVENILTV